MSLAEERGDLLEPTSGDEVEAPRQGRRLLALASVLSLSAAACLATFAHQSSAEVAVVQHPKFPGWLRKLEDEVADEVAEEGDEDDADDEDDEEGFEDMMPDLKHVTKECTGPLKKMMKKFAKLMKKVEKLCSKEPLDEQPTEKCNKAAEQVEKAMAKMEGLSDPEADCPKRWKKCQLNEKTGDATETEHMCFPKVCKAENILKEGIDATSAPGECKEAGCELSIKCDGEKEWTEDMVTGTIEEATGEEGGTTGEEATTEEEATIEEATE